MELTDEEASNCRMDSLEHIGDYEIKLKENTLFFACIFDRSELRKNESIEGRLDLIKKDIIHLAKESCSKEA